MDRALAGNEGAAKSASAEREMRFDECGIEAKVSRLRDAMLSLSGQLEHARTQANRAARIAEQHQHGANGEVTVPVFAEGHNLASLAGDSYEGPFRRIQRLLG